MTSQQRSRLNVVDLEATSRRVRRETFEMIVRAGKGHIGGSLSCTDLLVALYHGGVLRYDPAYPRWSKRDRYIHSKGHAPESFYAVLANAGFFSEEELSCYGQDNALLGLSADTNIPGVEIHGGSLGHGLGIATGIAMAIRLDEGDSLSIAMIGDGESHEGSVWEAAMFAPGQGLGRLVAIVDYNRQMVLDYTTNLVPLEEKWKAFGWEVRSINGHDFTEILDAFADVRSRLSAKPLVIVAHTVKGKGVSFMEGALKWHHGVPTKSEVEIARRELSG